MAHIASHRDTADGSGSFPLTPVQQSYLLGRDPAMPLGGVSCHMYLEFDGPAVDPALLRAAVARVQERHPLLRTAFPDAAQEATPLCRPVTELVVNDFTARPAALRDAGLAALRAEMAGQQLDVSSGRVFDVRLSLLSRTRTRVHVDFDLLAADPPSMRLVLADLAAFYAGQEPPPVRYDFPAHQRRTSAGTGMPDMAPWRARLQEREIAPPQLSLVRDPVTVTGARFTRRDVPVPSDAWQRIRYRAEGAGIEAESVLLAAFSHTVARFSSSRDFLLNLPVFERPPRHPDLGLVVGDFTRLLLGSFAATAAGSLRELARETDQERHTAREPQFASAPTAVRELARDRRESPPPAGVVYTSLLEREWTTPQFEQHFGALSWMVSQTPQTWLDCIAWLRADGVCLSWDAAEDLFPPGSLDAMTELCGDLLYAFAYHDWDEALPARLPAAQQRTRDQANDTARPESGRLLHERFFELAAAEPDRPALISEDVTVGRGRLADRALRIAASLRARGLRDGDPVAVRLSSPLSQIPAVLGVLAAGGCYVPVGPDQPPERGERICRSADVRLGIDDGPGQGALPSWIVRLTLPEAETAEPLPGPRAIAPSSLAYVLFTSGSTGQPKGVEITHRSAVNTVEDINERWSVGPADRGMLVSGLDFDLSVYEIFGPLAAGGAVVFPEPANSRNPQTWLDLADDHRVTLWDSVPVLLDVLITAAEGGDRVPSSLRLVLTGGDWIGTDLPDRLHRLVPGCRFVACGGATEGSIYSNYCEIDHLDPSWPSVPYGWPLGNQRYRVVDAFGRDCPDWVTGELWIGGVGVARGYRNDPERTSERFLERDHCRWYRTGDLGRYRPGGILEFLGRTDHQVKFNGYRVELGEVEAALHSHDDVRQAVTVVTGQAGQRQLVAYLVPAGERIDISAVKEHAESRLPEYARPAHYRVLPDFPLSGNGKVDRKALASWSVPENRSGPAEPPRTDVERALAEEWTKILKHPVHSRRQSFFDLGGDSLLAMKLSIGINDRFGRRLPMRQLFRSPTVADMASLLEDGERPPESVP